MTTAELILYATPEGPLAEALDAAFAEIARTGPTTAQEYPPHCTLTGFFRREEEETARIAAEVERARTATSAESDGGPVDVVALTRRADWIGLELRSDWLHDVTRGFVDIHAVGPHEDPLRPKDWLHLSIAYGVDDLSAALRATADFDHRLPARWSVALWRRHPDGTWTRP